MALSDSQWEYQQYTYPLKNSNYTWVTLADYGYCDPLAREIFWDMCQEKIGAELQRWQNDGWEFIEPPSSKNLQFHCREAIDDTIDLIDVMIWIATFGIALGIRLLLGHPPRRYIVYELCEFSLLMRRPALPARCDSLPVRADAVATQCTAP